MSKLIPLMGFLCFSAVAIAQSSAPIDTKELINKVANSDLSEEAKTAIIEEYLAAPGATHRTGNGYHHRRHSGCGNVDSNHQHNEHCGHRQ